MVRQISKKAPFMVLIGVLANVVGVKGFLPSLPSERFGQSSAVDSILGLPFASTTSHKKTEGDFVEHTAQSKIYSVATAAGVVENAVAGERDAWLSVPPDEYDSVLQTAILAAKAAGSIIVNNVGAPAQQTKVNIKDIVTEFDSSAQRAIEETVRGSHPEHLFLGEEDVAPGSEASAAALRDALNSSPSGWVWTVDPIDGTANFAAGLPMCVVSIGVAYKGTVVVAVVYDPHREELFTAIRGRGAFLNEKERLKCGAVAEMKDAVINAGYPADPNARDASMRGMKVLSGRSRGIRVIACSALTTAWIACGRLSAHFGYDLSSWDLAAGALLISEAGGLVTDLDGSPYQIETRNMLCSNGIVHDEILGVLREADAVSYKPFSKMDEA